MSEFWSALGAIATVTSAFSSFLGGLRNGTTWWRSGKARPAGTVRHRETESCSVVLRTPDPRTVKRVSIGSGLGVVIGAVVAEVLGTLGARPDDVRMAMLGLGLLGGAAAWLGAW